MANLIHLEQTRRHLALALEAVHHDRWVFGGLRDGRLRIIGDSETEREAPVQPIFMELSHLSRRCLFERHPIAVSSVVDPIGYDDWERDWPALIYVPIGVPKTRPVGLLIVGCSKEHWYTQDEIDYVAALGVTLTAAVSAVTGLLGRLSVEERHVAQLIAEGFSDLEVAKALAVQADQARALADDVLRKLSLRSRFELRELFPYHSRIRPHLL
jgi:DNA-binding CsgD family transcriptional regulator